MLAGPTVVAEADALELASPEVKGGVEKEALAPACAATCSAHVNESKKESIIRQAIGVAITARKAKGLKRVWLLLRYDKARKERQKVSYPSSNTTHPLPGS